MTIRLSPYSLTATFLQPLSPSFTPQSSSFRPSLPQTRHLEPIDHSCFSRLALLARPSEARHSQASLCQGELRRISSLQCAEHRLATSFGRKETLNS